MYLPRYLRKSNDCQALHFTVPSKLTFYFFCCLNLSSHLKGIKLISCYWWIWYGFGCQDNLKLWGFFKLNICGMCTLEQFNCLFRKRKICHTYLTVFEKYYLCLLFPIASTLFLLKTQQGLLVFFKVLCKSRECKVHSTLQEMMLRWFNSDHYSDWHSCLACFVTVLSALPELTGSFLDIRTLLDLVIYEI